MAISTLMMVIIAGAALFISLWQIYATRRHNRLSVTPKIVIGLSALEGEFGIYIKNAGVGPAIIKKFSVCLNGKEIYPLLKKGEYDKIISNSFPLTLTFFPTLKSFPKSSEPRNPFPSKTFPTSSGLNNLPSSATKFNLS